MQRDTDIAKIKACLDSIAKDESKKIQYEAIMTLANYSMNVDIHVGEDGIHHEVQWFNRKIPDSISYDEDVHRLAEYIDHIVPPS